MCTLTGVSRAGFYRRGVSTRSASVELRDQVQRVALEWPTYGSRRITAELRRGGLSVNRKRVQRLMWEDNLLCLRKRKFVTTTDSAHGLKVYPNLGGIPHNLNIFNQKLKFDHLAAFDRVVRNAVAPEPLDTNRREQGGPKRP